jgi:hypothetical protein
LYLDKLGLTGIRIIEPESEVGSSDESDPNSGFYFALRLVPL